MKFRSSLVAAQPGVPLREPSQFVRRPTVKISSTTDFNGIKLLDGSKDQVNFQIGIHAEDSLAVDLQKSDSMLSGNSPHLNQSTESCTRCAIPTYFYLAQRYS